MSTTEDVLELRLPADPALALTARMFAGALARQAGAVEAADDLKLALSELLAVGVEGAAPEVAYRAVISDAGTRIEVAGVASPHAEEGPDEEAFARAHRMDLLTGLFPDLTISDATARFTVPPVDRRGLGEV